jgi:hypothetical protein
MLQALSKKHNAFLRPLKKKACKEERVTTMGLYDLGTSHDPGTQQEPAPYVRRNDGHGIPCHENIALFKCGRIFASGFTQGQVI